MSAVVANSVSKRIPSLFICHGGGPSFFLPTLGPGTERICQGSDLAKLISNLLENKTLYPNPIEDIKGVIVISGHYEHNSGVKDNEYLMKRPNGKHSLYYDYYGFPSETYNLTWKRGELPFDDEQTNLLKDVFHQNNLILNVDDSTGLDHGVFVPLKLMFDDNNKKNQKIYPLTEISLQSHLKPENHFKLGLALSQLKDQGFLIIGSGALTHNLGLIMRPNPNAEKQMKSFHEYVMNAVVKNTGEERKQLLMNIKNAPNFKLAHPREDHFVPLIVAAGTSIQNEPAIVLLEDSMGAFDLTSFAFL